MKKNYLILYNLLLAVGWTVLLFYWLIEGRPLSREVRWLLNICQVAAALEVVHAGLNWVKTPMFTCLVQVSSRIFVLFLINFLPESDLLNFQEWDGLTMILIAWSVTEIIRYGFYFTNLVERPISFLLYLRYTLFLVLYPLGVTGELLIMLSAFLAVKGYSIVLAFVILLVGLSYVYFFPRMYKHMLLQRKKKLL